jgi:hypothetical protein
MGCFGIAHPVLLCTSPLSEVLLTVEELGNMLSLTGPLTKSAFQYTSQPVLLVNIPERQRRDTQFEVKISLVLGASFGATNLDIPVTGYKTIRVLTTSDIVSPGVGKSHRSQAVIYPFPHDL